MQYEMKITADQLAAVNEAIEGWMVNNHDRYSILEEAEYLAQCTVVRFDDPRSKVRCHVFDRCGFDDSDDHIQDMFPPGKYPALFPQILLLAAAKMKLQEVGPGKSYPGNEDEAPDFLPADL